MEEEKTLLEQVDRAISETMGTFDPDEQNRVSRKPFKITEFEQAHNKEMAVFTHAKKMSEYIFVVTAKSPVKLRWSIVSRLINASVDVIENLYRANYERGEERKKMAERGDGFFEPARLLHRLGKDAASDKLPPDVVYRSADSRGEKTVARLGEKRQINRHCEER